MYVAEAYDIIEAPVHTAALVGTQAQFNYSATYTSGTDSIKWGFYDESLGSPTLRTIYTDAQGKILAIPTQRARERLRG